VDGDFEFSVLRTRLCWYLFLSIDGDDRIKISSLCGSGNISYYKIRR
jgi:hypothetical protein